MPIESQNVPKVGDPLFTIFEQHLYNFQDSEIDRKTFIGNVVQEYLSHLRKLKIVIPRSMEAAVVEELTSQVNVMLVKKIYGCVSLDEYRSKVEPQKRTQARTRYKQLVRR